MRVADDSQVIKFAHWLVVISERFQLVLQLSKRNLHDFAIVRYIKQILMRLRYLHLFMLNFEEFDARYGSLQFSISLAYDRNSDSTLCHFSFYSYWIYPISDILNEQVRRQHTHLQVRYLAPLHPKWVLLGQLRAIWSPVYYHLLLPLLQSHLSLFGLWI